MTPDVAHGTKSGRNATRALLVAMFGIGALLLAASFSLPRFSDPEWQTPFLREIPEQGPALDAFAREWRDSRDAAATHRRMLEDAGAGLVLLALSAFVLVRPARRDGALTTPATPARWFGLSAAATGLLCAGLVVDLFARQRRDDFPWWADTIVIPLMGVPPLFVAGMLVSGFLAAACGRGARSLPLRAGSGLPGPRWLALVLAPLAALPILLLAGAVVHAPALVPALTLSVYLGISILVVSLHAARDPRAERG